MSLDLLIIWGAIILAYLFGLIVSSAIVFLILRFDEKRKRSNRYYG